MPAVVAADLGELAVRVVESLSPNAWFVLMVEDHAEEVASALQEEISALAAPTAPPVHRLAVGSSHELALAVRDHALDVLIVTISATFTSAEWANVDVNRSRFQRDGATVLVLGEAATEQLEVYFPDRQPIPFVRFDLNDRGHSNDDLGLRAHVHPGHDDIQLPSPLLPPLEALKFMLYRCRLRRDTPRA